MSRVGRVHLQSLHVNKTDSVRVQGCTPGKLPRKELKMLQNEQKIIHWQSAPNQTKQ